MRRSESSRSESSRPRLRNPCARSDALLARAWCRAQKIALDAAKADGKTKKDMPPFWDTKVIIKGVSGCFAPGTLSAISAHRCTHRSGAIGVAFAALTKLAASMARVARSGPVGLWQVDPAQRAR